jgi:hypothetical protein
VNKRTRLTEGQRAELVEIYTRDGMNGVEALARRYGVTAKHVANIASDMGIRRQPNRRQTEQDPRWSWAIERGAVVA